MAIRRIISGGQTGVDRGALDAAIELGIPHGGWCPRGRRAEDGRIPDHYRLDENDSTAYAARTERNVCDSDGTLIIASGELVGGTKLTWRFAQRYRKPCLVIDVERLPALDEAQAWLLEQPIEVLNVAGPRESQAPGISDTARQLLKNLIGPVWASPI